MNFVVKESDSEKRLDKFLTEKLITETRSQIKKMIQSGAVLINDKPAKVHQFLRPGDKIKTATVQKMQKEIKPTTQEEAPPRDAPKVIFEDSDFIVLEKPTGWLVHPTEKRETDTLADWITQKFPETENVGEYDYRGGVIHRLDKDVSGIMVVAKNDQAFYHLKKQFKEREVKKEYNALVYGQVSKDEGQIDLPIGRNKEGQFVAHPRQGKLKYLTNDREAHTKYKVLERFQKYTLLEVNILTGRTHQIRAHLSAIGYPILGDRIYKPKKKIFNFLQTRIKVVNLPRIFLHSTKIGFKNLKNEWVEFSSPLPPALTDFLNESR